MKPRQPPPPVIPSFLGAMRCTCGKAHAGRYCDGSHLDAALGRGCEELAPRDPPPENEAPKGRTTA